MDFLLFGYRVANNTCLLCSKGPNGESKEQTLSPLFRVVVQLLVSDLCSIDILSLLSPLTLPSALFETFSVLLSLLTNFLPTMWLQISHILLACTMETKFRKDVQRVLPSFQIQTFFSIKPRTNRLGPRLQVVNSLSNNRQNHLKELDMVAALSSSEKETLPSCHVSYERFSISFQFPPSYIFSHCSPSEIYDQHYERSRSLVSNKTPS